jgi:MarR family transcriptional regulator, organic hydroperoxide resistance regulator
VSTLNQEQTSQELVDNLFFLFKALHRGCHSEEFKTELTFPQRMLIGMLARFGNLSVKQLGEKMELSHSTISGIIDRLERKGLVSRFQDPEDRRFTKVILAVEVKQRMEEKRNQNMFSGVVSAFKNANQEEQLKILTGLTTLRQLLDRK